MLVFKYLFVSKVIIVLFLIHPILHCLILVLQLSKMLAVDHADGVNAERDSPLFSHPEARSFAGLESGSAPSTCRAAERFKNGKSIPL